MTSFSCSTLLLFVVHLCVVTDANEFRSDYEYRSEGGGWFKLHRVPLDWHTAQRQCYHEGAVIASPLNFDVWNTLKKVLSEAKPSVLRVFSGVYRTSNHGFYTSVEGIPIEKLHMVWKAGQPAAQNALCLTYDGIGMETYECEQYLPYICYRPFSISDQLTECGTVDKEYKLDARTGHCYKFHARAEEWWRALRVCHAEGGHLAVIDSEAEADVLKDLFAQYPRLLYTPFQNSASVGFKEWGYNKSWWTIHGKQLEESGYAQWSQGQPDNAGAPRGRSLRQACGAVFRTGRLDDVWCEEPLAFICEKTKHSLLHELSPQT